MLLAFGLTTDALQIQATQDPGMHIAFVTDCSGHQAWMATLLMHTAGKVGQDDPITWVRWGCKTNATADDEKLMQKFYPKARLLDIAGVEDEVLKQDASWIKPMAFQAFMDSDLNIPDDSVVAMIDPDFVFMSRLRLDNLADRSITSSHNSATDTPGAPAVHELVGVAQHYECCDDLGVPYILTAKAWRKLLPEYSNLRFTRSKGWGSEQEAFAIAAKNAGVTLKIFDHFMVSDTNQVQHGEGWDWVKETLKTPEGDVCKTKVAHETTGKLPTVLHVTAPWISRAQKEKTSWQFSKYQIPPGWQHPDAAGILDCEMPLFAEPPADLIQTAQTEQDQLHSWGLCTIVHSLNSMLVDFKKETCPQGYNDAMALKIGSNWQNEVLPSAEVAASAHNMNFAFMKKCGEELVCTKPTSVETSGKATSSLLEQSGEKQLKVAYAVFVSDLKDAAMKDVMAVQAHGFRQAAAKSRHNVEFLALVPERFPEADEQFLKQVGFTHVFRKPLPVHPSEIDPVQGKLVLEAFNNVQGAGDANSKFLMAEETLKYWPLSMTEYDRVLMLDADVMVLDPMDELMERKEDFVGTYDHGLDIAGSTVPPVQGGFLLYRPNGADFQAIKRLTKEGSWGGNGWKNSGIGYAYGGTGPDGLLAYFYHKGALPQLKKVGKKQILDGPYGNAVPGVRMFGADRSKYDVVITERLEKDLKDTDEKEIIDGVKSMHFTGGCAKPWQCHGAEKNMFLKRGAGNLCDAMTKRWFAMRASLEKEKGQPVSHKGCVNGKYKVMN